MELYLTLIPLTVIVIGIAACCIRNDKLARLRRAEFEKERQKYVAEFGGQTTEKLAGMPYNVEIGPDGLPRVITEFGPDGLPRSPVGWGERYTFYTAPYSHAYHCKRGCSGASTPTHACQVGRLHACHLCCPCLPEISWYERYRKIKAIKDKYKID